MTSEVPKLADRRRNRFSDFATEPAPLDGEKIKIDSILNQEIEILGYRISPSKYAKNQSGQYLMLQIRQGDGQINVLFSGSDVLIRQLETYGKEVPFYVTIKKIKRYYTLT